MRGVRSILVAAMLGLAGCAAVQGISPMPDVYVMRHLHTPVGASDPDLTAEGVLAASLLVDRFRRDKPKVIFVTRTKRAMQTAAPLARAVGVTPTLYDPADTPGLVAAVARETGTILIVGHSNTVPVIIEALAGQRPAPLTHGDFGDLWHITGATRATRHTKISR